MKKYGSMVSIILGLIAYILMFLTINAYLLMFAIGCAVMGIALALLGYEDHKRLALLGLLVNGSWVLYMIFMFLSVLLIMRG